MALKAALMFLLVSFLVVITRVSSDKETLAQVETLPKAPVKVPAVAPVKAPVAIPAVAPVKAPPVVAPVKAPPVAAPVKAPTPTPIVKPPVKVLPPVPVSACSGLCKVRCAAHSRKNRCLRACGTCCYRCRCVPPGTSGNYEKCGKCYTEMKTKDNKHKCP
ncbi:Gibberellin regulated protein [Macleaya cordata]|uniref:Gibberellin regulated protein n=1 Tax=Macleaya cordata TaxID=56857 RepID=A0A200R0Q6_MACCD|nr:Gibberellin regulated protein [Macleaya cordata]